MRITPPPLAGALSLMLALGTAAPARAIGWTVVPAESRLGFEVAFHQAGRTLRGAFSSWQAEISLDPARPEGARIAVSVRVASARTGDRQADPELAGGEWFAARLFPQARFVSSQVRLVGEGHYEADGQLTLRDRTRPVVLPFTLTQTDGRARAEARLEIDRVAFGIGDGPDPHGDLVGRMVTVLVSVVATRAP